MRAVLRRTPTQPIVYVEGDSAYIFFNKRVYACEIPTEMALEYFPIANDPKILVCLLVFVNHDSSKGTDPPIDLYKGNRVIIQASSPSPIPEHSSWIRKVNYHCTRIVIPRWTRRELIDNFRKAGVRNDEFIKRLMDSIRNGIEVDYRGVHQAKLVLKQKISKASSKALTFDENNPGVRATIQKLSACSLDQLDEECILSTLIDDAVHHVGLVPRDVYAYVLRVHNDYAMQEALWKCNWEDMAATLELFKFTYYLDSNTS
ncbi:hypothetical protein E1B28_003431 [Marasmius oreades]|uniref:Uncharacterized protein n=1 Tax=Marasmius oreades TaxID=181124 RepID=A0A9P7RM77_9AGAR|nr:uncharacterized protein E1B28_003431 [Marasmius oreades]KAG7085897.1 hypothetical protein E1B28_003431 [Marasmius oreades]